MPVSSTLLALTTAALAIPGMSPPAQAQEQAQPPPAPVTGSASDALPRAGARTLLDYRFSFYREGGIPGSKTASGVGSPRYDVDSHQFRAAMKLNAVTDFTADATVETMSGASPWFILPGTTGKPLQVMSGASIHDFRQALQLQGTRRLGEVTGSLLAGYSHERDYQATNAAIEGGWDFNGKLITLSGGAGYTYDQINPTGGGSARFPTRMATANAAEVNGYLGLTQVLTAETVVQSSVSFEVQHSFLSDPYKEAWIASASNTVNDTRPDIRHRLSWTTRLRQNIPTLDAAVHVDYRYYKDDWQVTAHTVELGWYQSLPAAWALVPRLRWYSQSQASFYAPYYNAPQEDGLYSSDYRLSPFGAVSASMGAYKQPGSWNFSLRCDYYRASGAYSLHRVEVENPALVSYRVISAGIAKTF
jgi:hypothetical protein